MQTLEQILEAARRLPEDDQKRLVEELQDNGQEAPSDDRRRAAMQRWLAQAGTLHSDFTDVSTDKYKHLADVYADER